MSGPILSLDAEQSCTLINETLSAHDDAIDAITTHTVRRRRLPQAAGTNRAQIQRQATLIRFLSITESFSTERLLAEMNTIMSTVGHPGAHKMREGAHDNAIRSWSAMQTAYHSWLGIPKGTWTTIIELTNARNAVAHGSGQLTWLQQRDNRAKLEEKLYRHLITLDDNRIILTEKSIDKAAKTCVAFIKNLDAALLS